MILTNIALIRDDGTSENRTWNGEWAQSHRMLTIMGRRELFLVEARKKGLPAGRYIISQAQEHGSYCACVINLVRESGLRVVT